MVAAIERLRLVTSTWVDAVNLGVCHTWRAWCSRVRKKQLEYIMGPRDLVSTTWYQNKTRIRTVGPQSRKSRRGNSKNFVFVLTCRKVGVTTMRSVAWRPCRREWKELLWRSRLLRWRPGTRTSSWCLGKSGQWRVSQLNVVTQRGGRSFGRRHRKHVENSMPGWVSCQGGKVVKKPVVTKLWVNGRATVQIQWPG